MTAAEHSSTGITEPGVEELIALRAEVARHRPPKRAQTRQAGIVLSPLRGRGMEYAESREYVPGDDARHIDWRLTARTGRTHTKMFQAETERVTLVLVDVSPRLFFGSRTRYKSVQAARVAATALWSAVRDGDRVGLAVLGQPGGPGRMATGMRGALPLMHKLTRAFAKPEPATPDAIVRSLNAIRPLLRGGARLVVVGDVHTLEALKPEHWRQLQGVEVHVVLLIDALEQHPPAKSLPVQLHGHTTRLALDQAAAEARWRTYFSEPVAAFAVKAVTAGVHVHVVDAADDATAWLAGFNAPQARVA